MTNPIGRSGGAPMLDEVPDKSGPTDGDEILPPEFMKEDDGFDPPYMSPILDNHIDPDAIMPPSVDLEPEFPRPTNPPPPSSDPLNPGPAPILE